VGYVENATGEIATDSCTGYLFGGVRALAGEEYEVAYVPAEARALLARFDARSQHYDVASTPTTHAR